LAPATQAVEVLEQRIQAPGRATGMQVDAADLLAFSPAFTFPLSARSRQSWFTSCCVSRP
jgi:hypothetical protein